MRLGKPADHEINEYNLLTIGGISVYCHRTIEKLPETMNIDIDIEGENISTRLVMRSVENRIIASNV